MTMMSRHWAKIAEAHRNSAFFNLFSTFRLSLIAARAQL